MKELGFQVVVKPRHATAYLVSQIIETAEVDFLALPDVLRNAFLFGDMKLMKWSATGQKPAVHLYFGTLGALTPNRYLIHWDSGLWGSADAKQLEDQFIWGGGADD